MQVTRGGGGGGGEAAARVLRTRSPRVPSFGVAATQARICGAAQKAAPWYAACCGDAMAALVSATADGGPPAVPAASFPQFTCAVAATPSAPLLGAVSCAAVLDGYCDCPGDGSDEPASAACSPAGWFWCASGARVVDKGALVPALALATHVQVAAAGAGAVLPDANPALGYIPSSKVGDGIADCVSGEDEAPAAA